jgi:Na+/H+ antiporter NhaD/arsenite permease-like protein
MFLGIPIEFILFGATLLGVALFHHQTLYIALGGMLAITLYKLGFAGFSEGTGLTGLFAHFAHEWVTLANLLGLLVGFALLSDHFEKSQVPDILPKFLPDDWKGGFVLLILVFVLSSFLDNIAAALIGATIAQTVFRHKVHIWFGGRGYHHHHDVASRHQPDGSFPSVYRGGGRPRGVRYSRRSATA